ncbi:MAG TPA: choice-of-anchor D domain-containing protein, partial [Methylomirabilota bacterium]|nr:choice-of-anchor D domain-containing protein [Methylomirabilota bacterium]
MLATAAEAGFVNIAWDAPTTSADGSDLNDLARYRVYLGLGGSPACPSSTFGEVSSPTPSPSPGSEVVARLSGLTAGATYFVRVTAVDLFGNESPCSAEATAVAQEDFFITPGGLVDFGSVPVGGTADRTYTLSNTGPATITGTASAPAPFSVVSAGSFSVPAGGTRSVVVRFAPTAVGAAAGSATFTSSSGTVTRGLSGTATPRTFNLTVSRSGPGSGTVSSAPGGISCGSTCTAGFTEDTTVTLTAAAAAGSIFTGWSGGGCS